MDSQTLLVVPPVLLSRLWTGHWMLLMFSPSAIVSSVKRPLDAADAFTMCLPSVGEGLQAGDIFFSFLEILPSNKYNQLNSCFLTAMKR